MPTTSADPFKLAGHFVWSSWGEVAKHRLGVDLFRSEDAVQTNGIETVAQWRIPDLALSLYGKVLVPLYETFGPDTNSAPATFSGTYFQPRTQEYMPKTQTASITPTSASSSCSHKMCSTTLSLSSKLSTLETAVALGEILEAPRNLADARDKEREIWILTLSEDLTGSRSVEKVGEKSHLPPQLVTADMIATICYTSRTTANPRGVVQSQGALAAATYFSLCGWDLPADANPVMLPYLPLAHIYERTIELNVTPTSSLIGYTTGSPLHLIEGLQTLKPNILASVPRALDRIHQAIAANLLHTPGLKGASFRRDLAQGPGDHPGWGGGWVDLLGNGSAPVEPGGRGLLRVTLACDLVQGMAWPRTVERARGHSPPSVPPTSGSHVPERIDPEATKEMIDGEGWIHTGGIGPVDEVGRFRIIDRHNEALSRRTHRSGEDRKRLRPPFRSRSRFASTRMDPTQSYLVVIVVWKKGKRPASPRHGRSVRASLRVVSERRGVGSNLDLNKLVPCRMFCAKKGDMVRSPTLELEASRPTNSLQGSAAPTPRCVYVPGPSVLAPNDSSPILDRDGWSKRFSAQRSLRTGLERETVKEPPLGGKAKRQLRSNADAIPKQKNAREEKNRHLN
ncbi:hypothetical protein BJ322DRAFT_1017734 [Thelephora terrestris]|uniref:AMP-dependent synthetase/ligase domain-containing protein n=1 Tax=Thelephora terrestris TaxID=56493 RepID=A0A9P6HPX9_9AGAM|nr:hypothetical protein BJ322DRAFT_1017734 [Thelephora terrestris]